MNRLLPWSREKTIAAGWGLVVTAALAVTIVAGSRNLSHFDAALVGYTFATIFAAFGITYRYAMWLQRPPTKLFWRRGWQVFLMPKYLGRNIREWFARVTGDFALNRFIFRRSPARWGAHWMIMWGCIIAGAITLPLVFGWIHFETVEGKPDWYRTFVFGFPTMTFPVHSIMAFMIFHGLVWASILVIAGVMIAMRRRMRDHGAAALQHFAEDFLPLILLFAISVTGVMLTASYSWMSGYAYDFLAILHAIAVIFTLLWMPFGKFFHIFQRPAQLGVAFYRDIASAEGNAACARCGDPWLSEMQRDDLIAIERALGYRYETADPRVPHYQHICPRCRRMTLGLAQGKIWQEQRDAEIAAIESGDPFAEITPRHIQGG